MSRIHLLILWALAITAGIIYFKGQKDPTALDAQTNLEIGSNLIAGDTVESIDGFKIVDGENTVTVKNVNGDWSIEEKGNFPANFSSVNRVFEALRGAKVAQGVVASQEFYDRFNLDPAAEDEEERPESITLISNGEEGTTVFLGKSRESTGGGGGTAGRFVRLSDDDSGVYVVSESFGFLGADPDNWIEKLLTPLEEKPIRFEVSAPNDDSFKTWTVSRKTVLDDLLVENLGEKEETKTNETSLLKTAFSRAPFVELATKEDFDKEADPKAARQVKATDSAGSVFLLTITPQKEEEKEEEKEDDPASTTPAIDYYVTIEVVSGPTKPEPPAEDADVQAKAVYQERVANLAQLSEAVNRMGEIYKERIFLVNKANVSAFLKNRDELIQPKKEKKDPVSVTTDPIEVPNPGNPAIPGTGNNKPPSSIARPEKDMTDNKPKVEAVTPPIRIPPLPEGSDPVKPDEPVEPPKKPELPKPEGGTPPPPAPPAPPETPEAPKPEEGAGPPEEPEQPESPE